MLALAERGLLLRPVPVEFPGFMPVPPAPMLPEVPAAAPALPDVPPPPPVCAKAIELPAARNAAVRIARV